MNGSATADHRLRIHCGYGTSAALLVLARNAPSADRNRFAEGVTRYVNDRSAIEHSLVESDTDLAALDARLAIEWKTAFKCADLLYALSAAPPAVKGREELINAVLSRIDRARRESGGWAVDLDARGDVDSLATASIVRAHIRRVLMDAIAALSSPAGYVYTSSGHMKSARTHSILMDTLWRLDQTLAAAGYALRRFRRR
ncbi:MAG: hypothetical protein ACRDP6_18025 [Actinoallomurus sp.]